MILLHNTYFKPTHTAQAEAIFLKDALLPLKEHTRFSEANFEYMNRNLWHYHLTTKSCI